MAIAINGSGTITGLSEGGIEDAKIISNDIKAGTIALDRLSATGTASATTFLRGDNAWSELTTSGTWTPAMGSAYTSITYVDQKGRYTKVGPLVYAQFRIGMSAATSAGGGVSITITGLPFAASDWTGEQPAGGSLIHSTIDSFQDGDMHGMYISGGGTTITFQEISSGNTTRAGADISSNKFIQGQVIYTTGLS